MENTFWRNVVESWAEYVQETVETSNILSLPLWNNVFIKIENKSVFYQSWYIKNLCYVNDLVDESAFFMSPTELINKFNLKCTISYRRLFATATLVNHETPQGRKSYSWLPQSQLFSFVHTF